MNGNPIFEDQGPLPTFGHLTNSPADSLGAKDLKIGQELVNRDQSQDSFPVILAGVSSENLSNQDGGSEDGDEREKAAHNLSCQKNCEDRLPDDILMFVGEGSSDDNNSSHTSVNVALESPFLEGQNAVILPLDGDLHLRGVRGHGEHDDGRDSPVNLTHTVDEHNPEVVASMALPVAIAQHHDAVPMLITSKSNSPKIGSLSVNTSKMITIDSEAGNNHQRLATTLATMSAAGGGGLRGGGSSVLDLGDGSGFSVRDLNLVGLPENAGIVNVIAGVNISPGEIVTSIPSHSTACLEPSTSESDNKTVCGEPTSAELSVSAPLSNSADTIPTIIDPQAVSILNPGQLELNVATIPASGASLGQPIMYIITSRDRNTGATQRFRVTVDAESVATAPIGTISLNTELPSSLQIGSHWVVEQQSAVPVAGLVSGNILSTDGSTVAASVVDGSGDNTAVGLNTQVVPSIETESATTGLIKTELESGDSSESFTTGYLQNKRNVKEEKVMCCTFEGCNEIFTTKKKLKLHQLIHADDRPHKCTVDGCDWTFPTLYKLRRHLAGHGGERPFHCDVCNAPFSTIYNLKMHRKRHDRSELFVCDVKDCNQAFPTMIKLKNHLRIHFPDRRIKCAYPGCNKSFTTTCGMGSHLRIHERNETSFPCLVEGCNKIYNKACRLKLHMRSHTGERPFKCTAEGCTWAFTCIQKLSRHMVQHTGDRKHVCDRPGCQKLFTRLEHLKTHLKTHTGEKPFACPEKDCNARFASRSSLYMHVRRHKEGYTAKQKPQFTCPMDDCDQSYSTKDGLKKHILTVHSVMLPSSSNESELVYIPTENPQAMVDAMTDPGLLQTPKIVRITQSDDGPNSNTANQSSPNGQKTDTSTNTSANQSQSNAPTPYTSVGLIVDTTGAPVNFVNSPARQEGAAATSSGGAGGLHHENWSGSARTDFMYRPGGKKWRSTRNSESGESETDGSLSSSYIPTSFSMTTSASLTLRDPATGTRYVQTQLLQDDPPDESELAFQLTSHPTTPDPSSGDLNVSTLLPVADASGHPHCPSSSGVDFLQTDHEAESSIGGFRESTINLQDLE